jgi:photosystem II stability/assembly factor-like uncharacterized protein
MRVKFQNIIIAIISMILYSATATSQTNFWHHTGGPLQPAVNTITVLNDDRIMVCTKDGWLYQSKDNGDSWTAIGCFNDEWPIYAVGRSEWGDLYIGAQKCFLKSTDDGTTWVRVDANEVTYITSHLPNYLYRVLGNLLDRSTDRGSTWTGWYIAQQGGINAIAFDSTNKMYIGNERGIAMSTDMGHLWEDLKWQDVKYNRGFCITPDNRKYTATDNGLRMYHDSTDFWDIVALAGHRVNSIYRAPNGYMYAGSDSGFYRSINEGETWDHMGIPDTLMIISGNKRGWLFANVGGLFRRSNDNGVTWQQIHIHDLYMRHWVNAFTSSPDAGLFTGTTYGLFHSTDRGDTWEHLNPVQDYTINSLAWDSENCLLMGFNGSIGKLCPPYPYTNEYELNAVSGHAVLTIVRKSDGTLFAGTHNLVMSGPGVIRSTDNGQIWYSMGFNMDVVKSIAINSSGDVFNATYHGDIYKSTDNGVTWTGLTGSLNYWNSILFNAHDTLFAGTDENGVYLSVPPYVNWESINIGLKNYDVQVLATDREGHVYAGTKSGTYQFNPDKRSWKFLGLDSLWISGMYADPDGYLYAGAWNHGVYRSTEKTTGMDDNDGEIKIPTAYELSQNFPNPCNPSTTIHYAVAKAGHVKIKIYDILGKEVASLVDGEKLPGTYSIWWNAQKLPSGVYLYRMEVDKMTGQTSGLTLTKKLLVLK